MFQKQDLCIQNKLVLQQSVVLRSFPLQEKACCRNNKKNYNKWLFACCCRNSSRGSGAAGDTVQEGSDGGHGFKSSVRLGKKEECGRRKNERKEGRRRRSALDGKLRLRARTSRKHERHARGECLPLLELRDERKKWEGDVMPREVSRKWHVFCRTMGHVSVSGVGRPKNRIRRLNTIISHMILAASRGRRK